MKCLRRYFCVLLCFVLFLGVFSVGVSAEGDSSYRIHQFLNYPTNTFRDQFFFNTNNGSVEKKEYGMTFGNALPSGNYINSFRVFNINTDILFTSGRKVSVNFNNVYFSLLYEDWYNGELLKQSYVTSPTYAKANIIYTDGTTDIIDVNLVKRADKKINMSVTFTPKKDVQDITFDCYLENLNKIVNGGVSRPGHTYDITHYFGEFDGDDKFQFTFEVSSEEAGLLSGIIEWLKGIWTTITEIPEKIWSKFSQAFTNIIEWFESVWTAITELPEKIWSFIEDGLKSLFVPSDDFILQFKDDMDLMLSEKLGAVYQVINITLDSWDRISANDVKNIITIPETTINLPENNTFSFGGVNVPIVPTGFEWLVDILKGLVGIVCTILFVNGLRKKYDEVMGVEQ